MMERQSLTSRLPGAHGFARAIHEINRFHWSRLPWIPGKWRLNKWVLACLDQGLLEPTAHLDGGLSLEIDRADYVQRHVFATGTWEEETTRLMLSCWSRPGSFLDVGAHVGYFTLLGAHTLGGHGRVHAFEPVPRSFELLKRNVAANTLDNVVLQNVACWSSAGPLTLHEAHGANSGKSSAIDSNAESRSGPAVAQHEVQAITLDDYARSLSNERVATVKIDIEGCEADALAGAWQMIATHEPIIVLEVSPHLLRERQTSASDLAAKFYERSYRCRLLDWEGPLDIDRGSGNVVFTPKEDQLPETLRTLLDRLPEVQP